MGHVVDVLNTLKTAGIPAEMAYPGRKMPHITKAVAAVMLEKEDYTNRITVVRVTVCSPAASGGSACQSAAEAAGKVLAKMAVLGMDTVCVQEECVFDGSADCYMTALKITFSPTPEPETEPECAVFQVNTRLTGVVAFSAWRKADTEKAVQLADAVWQIRLTEEFLPGAAEQPGENSGFQLKVERDAGIEVFSDCIWTAVDRDDDLVRLRQIRTGTAGSRSYTPK